MRDYSLNTESARASQGGGSKFIGESGKYVGVFTRAEAITSNNGSDGVEFTFESQNNGEADFLTLWTHNKAGDPLFGLDTLNAIMTCMRVKKLAATQTTLPKFNFDRKEKVNTQMHAFLDLMNKPVGLLIRREEYVKQATKEVKEKNAIFQAFTADTEQVASEVLDAQGYSGQLASAYEWLMENPLKEARDKPVPTTGTSVSEGNKMDNFDDDIPF